MDWIDLLWRRDQMRVLAKTSSTIYYVERTVHLFHFRFGRTAIAATNTIGMIFFVFADCH
jgi:hypothetical protein